MILSISGKMGSGKDTVGSIIQYLTDKNVTTESFEFWYASNLYSVYQVSNNIWQIKKFADKLKDIACMMLGCTRAQLEDQEFKKTILGPEWNFEWYVGWENEFLPMTVGKGNRKPNEFAGGMYQYTVREFLQKLGTEAMRNVIHENVWVNSLMADYKILNGNDFIMAGRHYGKSMFPNPIYPNWIITDTRFPNELEAVKQREGITIRVIRVYPGLREEIEKGNILHPSETALDDATFDYEIVNDGTIEDLVEKVKQILIKESII